MNKFFKKVARRVVAIYANRIYRKAVKVANSWYEGTGKRYFVITDPLNESRLVALDTKGFLKLRHDLGISSKDCTVAFLKNTCWYYTPNEKGKDRIEPRELVRRRLAFVRDRLEAAKLLDEQK